MPSVRSRRLGPRGRRKAQNCGRSGRGGGRRRETQNAEGHMKVRWDGGQGKHWKSGHGWRRRSRLGRCRPGRLHSGRRPQAAGGPLGLGVGYLTWPHSAHCSPAHLRSCAPALKHDACTYARPPQRSWNCSAGGLAAGGSVRSRFRPPQFAGRRPQGRFLCCILTSVLRSPPLHPLADTPRQRFFPLPRAPAMPL